MESDSLHAASADSWKGLRTPAPGEICLLTSCSSGPAVLAHLCPNGHAASLFVYNLFFFKKRGILETGVFIFKGSKKITHYKATSFTLL